MSGETMMPFSGRVTRCSKCAHRGAVGVRYRPERYRQHLDGGAPTPSGEHLERVCPACGYRWAEACAEACTNGDIETTDKPERDLRYAFRRLADVVLAAAAERRPLVLGEIATAETWYALADGRAHASCAREVAQALARQGYDAVRTERGVGQRSAEALRRWLRGFGFAFADEDALVGRLVDGAS